MRDSNDTLKNDAEMYFNYGSNKYLSGNYDEAIAYFTKAIELNPNHKWTYISRGDSRAKLGDASGAIADYTIAIESNPTFAIAYCRRGQLRYALSEYIEGKVDFDNAHNLGYEHLPRNYGNLKVVHQPIFSSFKKSEKPNFRLDSYSHEIFISVMGNVSVGKTQFISRFIKDTYTQNVSPTIMKDIKPLHVYVTKEREYAPKEYPQEVRLCIQNISDVKVLEEDPQTKPKVNSVIKYFDNIILCYDITNLISFNQIKSHWYCKIKEKYPNAKVFLVGLKCDEHKNKAVDVHDAQKLADNLGIPFFESSAKYNINIDEVFATILRATYRGLEMENLRYTGNRGDFCLQSSAVLDFEMTSLCKLMERFKTIKLDNNKIGPQGLKKIIHLNFSQLYIGKNRLGDEGAEIIANMKLNELSIQKNQITDRGITAILQMTTLEVLNIASNHFSPQALLYMINMAHLTQLILNGNNIDVEGIRYIAALSQLQVLSLKKCNLTDQAIFYLSPLSRLINLNVGGNIALTAQSAKIISQLPYISKLVVSYVPLGDEGMIYVANMCNLTYLEAENSNIGNMGAYELSTSYSLVKIKMYKNPMNAESRNLIYKTMCMNENKTDNVFEDKAVVQAILICQAATQKNNFFNKIPFTVLDKILTFALQNIKRSQKSITNMHLLVYNNIYTSFFEKKFQWNTKLKNDNGVYRIFRPHLNSIKNLVKASKNENEPKISCKLM